jgi:hypothetical protein
MVDETLLVLTTVNSRVSAAMATAAAEISLSAGGLPI